MRTNHQSTGWAPPHCPNPKCKYHRHLEGPWPFRRRGSFRRKSPPYVVRRFDCLYCGQNFSSQTFSIGYWLKRPDLLSEVFMRQNGCMCSRQMARDLGCSPETISRHLARLGRHCMLFHMELWQQAAPDGALVVDGFESFEYSQYHPIHHHVAVEADTGFWLFHLDSELRRKGRMTKAQKRRREELEKKHGRPDPQAIRKDMTELLQICLANSTAATVRSDEHRSYPPAVRKAPCPVQHEVTNSKKPRTAQNPLFPVNELDLLIRHSQSNHKRETIAFSKRRQASAERLSILLVWKNYIKWRREKAPGVTAAMLAGITRARLSVAEVLRRRLFPTRIRLPDRWMEYYRKRVTTRELPVNRTHALKYAF